MGSHSEQNHETYQEKSLQSFQNVKTEYDTQLRGRMRMLLPCFTTRLCQEEV